MGFQSGINQMLGSIAGASIGIKMTLEKRQKDAMKKAQEVQEAKKVQRRNFMSYLQQQPTSLGGKVGDLPKDIQKHIASQYTKSQRKQMMDQMDKEKAKTNGTTSKK